MSRNNLQYIDEYMYFTFNNIHSSKYGLFIQNDIEDLKFNNTSGAKIEFASPQYQNGQYMLGVQRPQRKFPLKLAAEHITRADAAEITQWLKAGARGRLIFDFNTNWAFEVVINSDNEMNLYPQDNEFICSYEVEFVTVESPYAVNTQSSYLLFNDDTIIKDLKYNTWIDCTDYLNESVNNNYYVPASLLFFDATKYCIMIHNLGNLYSVLNMSFQYNYDENSASLNDFNINLYTDIGFSTQSIHVDGVLSNQIPKQTHVIEYRGKNNLFFIDNLLLQQAAQWSYFANDNLNILYSNDSIHINAVQPVIEIVSKDQLQNLNTIEYNWFVCEVSDNNIQTNNYYESTISEQNNYVYSHKNIAKIYYGNGTKIMDVITEDNLQNNKSHYYFGFYNLLFLEHSYNKNTTPCTYNGTIAIEQYTEAI